MVGSYLRLVCIRYATPETVSDLAETVRRLAGLHSSAPAAVYAVIEMLVDSTAILLKVAAPTSPVRDKVCEGVMWCGWLVGGQCLGVCFFLFGTRCVNLARFVASFEHVCTANVLRKAALRHQLLVTYGWSGRFNHPAADESARLCAI